MIRRRFGFLLVICLMVLPGFAAPACADDASRLKAAQDLLAVNQMDKVFDRTVDQMLDVQMKMRPDIAPYRDTMRAFFTKYMGWNSLKDDFARLYAESFTEDELKAITAFYITPAGKKAVQILPQLAARGAQIGQERVQAHMGELQTMMDEAMKKHQGKAP
jgi:hypothetical protein